MLLKDIITIQTLKFYILKNFDEKVKYNVMYKFGSHYDQTLCCFSVSILENRFFENFRLPKIFQIPKNALTEDTVQRFRSEVRDGVQILASRVGRERLAHAFGSFSETISSLSDRRNINPIAVIHLWTIAGRLDILRDSKTIKRDSFFFFGGGGYPPKRLKHTK